MPNPGTYALVVDPTMVGPKINVRFSRVLVDNGSAINIMYHDNMVNMGGNNGDNPGSCQQGATRVTVTGKLTKAMWCSFLSPMTRRVNSGEPRR